MLWRVLAVLGGLTFIFNGLDVMADDGCESVTWGRSGGRAQTVTMTCWDAPPDQVDGAWPPGTAGLVSVAGGLGLIALAAWPLISAYFRGPDIALVDFPLPQSQASVSTTSPGPVRHASGFTATATPVEPETGTTTAGMVAQSPGRRSWVDPFEVLDEGAVTAINRFSMPPDEVIEIANETLLSQLRADRRSSVLATAMRWWKVWAESAPSETELPRQTVRGLIGGSCMAGLVTGSLAVGKFDRRAQPLPDGIERALRAAGVKYGEIVALVDTAAFLERVPILRRVADHCDRETAMRLLRTGTVSGKEAELLLKSCRSALADGFLLGAML